MTTSIRSLAKADALRALLASVALVGCTGGITGNSPGGAPAQGQGGSVGLGGGGGGSSSVATGTPGTDPGRVTMHRLNLAEYDNTMRDLLGTKTRPSVEHKFPADDRGADFDNIAEVLNVSPLHLNGYNTAATALIAEALNTPAQRALLVSCDLAAQGESCARASLEAFLPRAWRREVTAAEVDGFMPLVTLATSKGDSAEVGFALALRAVLLSPHFIYRPEIDPPASVTPHALGAYELASRVSYFLWSSMPDASLFAAAKAGTLNDPATLTSQVSRMLADTKGQALVDNFAGQWLFIRLFDDVRPDPGLFPGFDEDLRAAFKSETSLLFREFAFNGMPADQLLTANFTFANARLAQFYGLAAVSGTEPTRVDLTNNAQRRGLLTQAGLLAANSHPNATSPVLRGKYVLTQLLCQGVPPPPPEVDTKLTPDRTGVKTLRQTLETHLLNPTCASCHSLMDPIGFGMENYDAIGAYRTTDNTLPVDATGALASGEKFNGAVELSQLIAKDPAFARCLATKLYTYALGRGAVLDDANHLDVGTLAAINTKFFQNGLKFSDLALSVATSPTFLNRHGDGG